jgi:magnesium transporter
MMPNGEAARSEGLSSADLAEIAAALAGGRMHQAWALLRRLHPGDAAEALTALTGASRSLAIDALRVRFEPRILSYLDDAVRREVFEALGPEAVASAIARLESDDAVDLMGDVAEPERGAVHPGVSSCCRLSPIRRPAPAG